MSTPETKKQLVISLFGGPGCGKSTTAAGVFYKLKSEGYNVELVTEYAKDKVWDKHHAVFDNQIYMFAKQHHRQFRLNGQVDAIITDSPLLLSLHYMKFSLKAQELDFASLVKSTWDTFENMSWMIGRKKDYNPKGRYQTKEEAKEIDQKLKDLLVDLNIPYGFVNGDELGAQAIFYHVRKYIEDGKN